jgi:hypothetical protein
MSQSMLFFDPIIELTFPEELKSICFRSEHLNFILKQSMFFIFHDQRSFSSISCVV